MPSVELDGVVELREAMRLFTPDLAKNLENYIHHALKPIVTKAQGYVPNQAPLTNWAKYSAFERGTFPWYDSREIRQGIYSSDTPSKPNKHGFSYAASIHNASVPGSIIETAGRKNKNGRKQAPLSRNVYGQMVRSGTKNQSKSDNPNAGKQFIDALGPLYKVARYKGQSGRVSRRMNGRLIYRAWGEDQGRINGTVLYVMDRTIQEFHKRTQNRHTTASLKKAA